MALHHKILLCSGRHHLHLHIHQCSKFEVRFLSASVMSCTICTLKYIIMFRYNLLCFSVLMYPIHILNWNAAIPLCKQLYIHYLYTILTCNIFEVYSNQWTEVVFDTQKWIVVPWKPSMRDVFNSPNKLLVSWVFSLTTQPHCVQL